MVFPILKEKLKIIYAGSSTKFCNDPEGSNLSPYSFTKASNVNLVKNFSDQFGIEYAIIYFYNVHGGREFKDVRYATLIAIFYGLWNYITK